MKILKSFNIIVVLLLIFFGSIHQLHSSPIHHLNCSLWSEYKNADFEGISEEEKTLKLQSLYNDMLVFVKTHNIRRVILKILDPNSFDFFNLEKFDSNRDDNFYYWAIKLNEITEVEALFDHLSFAKNSNYISSTIQSYLKPSEHSEKFQNLKEKFHWVVTTNSRFDPYINYGLLIRGITIDPNDASDGLCQKIINDIDQLKSSTNNTLLRSSMILKIDQKELVFANLALFPLWTDIRGDQPHDIGMKLPENFPSQGEEHQAPSWRPDQNHPLLDNVYLKMFDPRLISCVYQNINLLPEPMTPDISKCWKISENLQKTFQGIPYVEGPGKLYSSIGITKIEGFFTLFKHGETTSQRGKLIEGSKILVVLPDGKEVEKIVAEDPQNNRLIKVTSPISTTVDIEDAKYYLPPIPIDWTYPKISARLKKAIYYVFSTEFKPKNARYFGNWDLANMTAFFWNRYKLGFFQKPFFSTFHTNCCWGPDLNLVLYDFTTLPNGHPYPEFDWNLGNKVY